MAINYFVTDPQIGVPRLTDIASVVTTTALVSGGQWPLGTIVRARDAVNGMGEFVYLPGVASNAIGSVVQWSPTAKTVTLAATTANQVRPVAVSMTGNSSTTALSWYQIEGTAVIRKVTTAKINPDVAIYVNGSGKITPTASAGKQVLGARTINAATIATAASLVTVLIQRPHLQGQIT